MAGEEAEAKVKAKAKAGPLVEEVKVGHPGVEDHLVLLVETLLE